MLQKDRLNRYANTFLKVLVICLPMILYVLFTGMKNAQMYTPLAIFGDETGYFRVTKSFVEGASIFGNYGVTYGDDVAANFGGFSAHGPKYIVLYGILGKLFGWETYSILIFNLVILTAALAIFLRLVKPDNKQLICFTVLFVSFFPMLYFLISGMVETLHFAFILVFMGLFYKFYETREFKWYMLTFAFIFLLVFFRINYFVLFIPLVILYRQKTYKMLAIDIVLSLILSAFSYVFIGQFSSPYPSYLDSIISSLAAFDIFGAIGIVFTHAKDQFVSYFFGSGYDVFEHVFKYCYLAVMTATSIIGAIKAKKEKKFNLLLFAAIIMLSELLIVIFLYEFPIFRGFRTLSVFLFIPFICAILKNKKVAYVLCTLLVIVNLSVSSFYQSYISYANGQYGSSPVVTSQEEIDELFAHIPCDTSGDRWKNTIAVHNRLTYNNNVMFGFPGYAGMNYVLSDDFSQIDKCEYILADSEEIEDSINKTLYEKIFDSHFGVLYKKIQ